MLLKVKFYSKHLHKNDLETIQNPGKQLPGGVLKKYFVLKKAVLKNFAKSAYNTFVRVSFLIKF